MVKQTIQVFARLKPTKSKTGLYDCEEDESSNLRLTFTVPKDLSDGFINNKKETYKFRFKRIFDQQAKQEEVFENVAQPVVDNALQGYNGTIFAYGQTGSGKTFTITGGAERYTDRGLIPRTLSYFFSQFEKNTDIEFTLHISYLEIYNESGYDLLDPKHEGSKLEDLPKVTLMEDSDQNMHLKNLSTHQASNEEEALNLLFLGDTNRMIAETPMNQASTRSHCIFTIHITARESGSATIRRAKLHLVDLAGSERVSKTGVNGVLLTEAKYINLSLHYLEQVIVALSEKGRGHIPYRNSMMTSVLRDSLGGNCRTSMIATCSVDKTNIDESISTCRFAQRVAMIKNDAILNEELDPKLMIQKLKREVAQLKEELAMATGEQRTDELTEDEIERCRQAVDDYLDNSDVDAILTVGADMRKIHLCFAILKKMVFEKPAAAKSVTPPSQTSRSDVMSEIEPEVDLKEVKKLKGIIAQRDNEINILVNMLKKEKKRAADAMSRAASLPNGHHSSVIQHSMSASEMNTANVDSSNTSDSGRYSDNRLYGGRNSTGAMRGDMAAPPPAPGGLRRPRSSIREREKLKQDIPEKTKQKILGNLSIGRQEAFEIFRRDYDHNVDIEDNKHTLKQRYAEAKSLGQQVNSTRSKINHIKSQIEQHRMTQAMQGLVDPDNPELDEIEQGLRQAIEDEKNLYKQNFNRLKVLKTEIEHLQHLLEKQKVKLMKDFEIWWAEQTASIEVQQSAASHSNVKTAWNTPPLSPIKKSEPQMSFKQPNWSSVSQYPSNTIRIHEDRGQIERVVNHEQERSKTSAIPMTGDAQADADILAFMKARDNILKHAQSGHR